jgi:hypothetical protein
MAYRVHTTFKFVLSTLLVVLKYNLRNGIEESTPE